MNPRDFVFALGKAREFPPLSLRRQQVSAGEVAWRAFVRDAPIFAIGEAMRLLDAQDPAGKEAPR